MARKAKHIRSAKDLLMGEIILVLRERFVDVNGEKRHYPKARSTAVMASSSNGHMNY